MPPTSLFADMLGLLKLCEWSGSKSGLSGAEYYKFCPCCRFTKPAAGDLEGVHAEDCHLHATIALAEEQVKNA